MNTIASLRAREILDSRGKPTLEVDVYLDDGSCGRAAVPSGASTGKREAVELRDHVATRFGGDGTRHAVAQVVGVVAATMTGAPADQQSVIDAKLCKLDGTSNKSSLGSNVTLGVSMAVARAAASSRRTPLFKYLANGRAATTLPVPMFNVINGGAHADNPIEFQEFMIAPVGAPSFAEALRYGAETYRALKGLLKAKGYTTGVGDEGGFAPNLRDNAEAVVLILEAIAAAGFKPGEDIVLALDPAANGFYVEGVYRFDDTTGKVMTADEMIAFYADWVRQYPIRMLEDGLAEDDRLGWIALTSALGGSLQLVGDDIFVTHAATIKRAAAEGIGNAALIKLNQIGTLSETEEAISAALASGFSTVISHRSGETTDDFIADFAVATEALQIKTGAPCRGERVAKYNQLLRIEEELGGSARYAGHAAFGGKARVR